MCKVSLCLSCHTTSTDMQHDILGSLIRSGHLTSPGQIFLLIFWGQNACGSMYLGAKNTRVLSIFSRSFLVQTLFLRALISLKNSFCLICPGKVKTWPEVVKSGTVGLKTSRTSFHLGCEALFQLRGRWAGVPPPAPRCEIACAGEG